MKQTPASVEGKHVLLTGPVRGTVTKADGSVVDVTPEVIEFDTKDEAEEVAFLVGERFVETGHPDDVEVDEDGNTVQRPFVHEYDKKKFGKHPSKFSGEPAGTPRKG